MTKKIFIIAEIGINHNGDIEIAMKLIEAAKQSGCDAVKFQKRNLDLVYSKELLDSPRESPWKGSICPGSKKSSPAIAPAPPARTQRSKRRTRRQSSKAKLQSSG